MARRKVCFTEKFRSDLLSVSDDREIAHDVLGVIEQLENRELPGRQSIIFDCCERRVDIAKGKRSISYVVHGDEECVHKLELEGENEDWPCWHCRSDGFDFVLLRIHGTPL